MADFGPLGGPHMDRIRVILDYPIGTARQRKHALFTGHWMRPEHKEAKRKSNGDRSNCVDWVENESTEGNGNKQTVSSGSEDPCSPFLFLVLSMPHRALSPYALLMVFGQRQTGKTNPWCPGRPYPAVEAGLAPTNRREGRTLSTEPK